MELVGFSPSRELGDYVYFPEQLAHDLAGIVSLAQLVELPHDPPEHVFSLGNRHVRVVLALAFEALMMLEELLTEKFCKACARGTTKRPCPVKNVDTRRTILGGHARRNTPSVSGRQGVFQ
jgi:hypothetical protein